MLGNTNTADTTNTANMPDTANVNVANDQPSLTIAQAPSFCRLCGVELQGETWRAHSKSDGHVSKLQSKVAEPDGVTSSPSPPPSKSAGKSKRPASISSPIREKEDPTAAAAATAGVELEDGGDSDVEDDPSAPEFVPGGCLFCAEESSTFDDSMAHMAAVHSFSVPFQEFLAVDVETVVAYLHFIISGYRECICCGTQRSSLEGVQQHMIGKGHCRFDISADTEEFYEMPQAGNVLAEQTQRDDSIPVRLPSGRLVSHRNNPETQEPRVARRVAPDRRRLDPSTSNTNNNTNTDATPDPGTEVAHRRRGDASGEIVRSSEAILAAQLSRLRVADNRAQHKQEQRRRWRTERTNNTAKQKHFQLDAGDGRIGRQF